MIQRAELKPTEDYFQPLKSNGVYPAGFQKYFFLSSHFLSFEWKCLSCYLKLVRSLGADNVFLNFRGLYVEGNYAPRWIIPKVSPIPNLDDFDDEIWDF